MVLLRELTLVFCIRETGTILMVCCSDLYESRVQDEERALRLPLRGFCLIDNMLLKQCLKMLISNIIWKHWLVLPKAHFFLLCYWLYVNGECLNGEDFMAECIFVTEQTEHVRTKLWMVGKCILLRHFEVNKSFLCVFGFSTYCFQNGWC